MVSVKPLVTAHTSVRPPSNHKYAHSYAQTREDIEIRRYAQYDPNDKDTLLTLKSFNVKFSKKLIGKDHRNLSLLIECFK